MSTIKERIGKFGPLNASLINDTSFGFYRFFYRRSSGSNIYNITLNDIIMKHVNLNDNIYYRYNDLYDYLFNINANVNNVTEQNILKLKEDIRNNFIYDNFYNALEVILPNKEGCNYSNEDIENIYNAIFEILDGTN